MRFLWAFIAAIAMFLAGAIFAIGYGAYALSSGEKSTGYAVAYATLAIALAAEGISWVRAVRQTRAEARNAELPLLRYVRESRDPNVKMVLFEDTAPSPAWRLRSSASSWTNSRARQYGILPPRSPSACF